MTNKKNKCNLTLLCILIIFIIAILYVRISSAETNGFTVSSIDSVPIISNNKDLSKANFTLTLIANGGGQSVVGNFGNETFTNILTNLVIKYPLKIEIGNIKESLTYPILNQGMLFKYETHYIEPKSFWEGAKCDGSTYCFPINIPMSIQLVGPDKILAINRIPSGMYGAFGNPDVSWNGKMTVTINGVPISKDIGSGVTSAGSINFNGITGEFVANAKWVGSLVTGQATPNQNLYLPTYASNNELWQIAPKTYYDVYTKSLAETDITLNKWKTDGYGYWMYNRQGVQIFVNTCENSLCSKVINYINVHNNNLKTLTDSNEKIGYESVLSSTSTISTKKNQYPIGGSVTDILDRKIGNPVIIMTVKASTLQPYIQTGIPKIESITSDTFNSGNGKGEISIKVKNIGESQGTFATYLTEESGTFTGQSNVESAKITLDPQQSGIIKMNINYGTNLQNITKTGVITVYDVNYPDEKATTTKDFTINMNSPKLCKPDDYRIFSGEVYKCTNDGMDEIKVLDCDITNNLIKFVDDVPICEVINGNKNINEEITSSKEEIVKETAKEKEQKQEDGALITVLYWLSGFLILAIIFTFVNKIRNNEEKITKKNMDNSMILAGIIIGILYIYIQYVALESTLGLMLWTIIAVSITISAILDIISYILHEKLLPIKLSIAIAIGLFIIITAIATGLKDMMCDSWFKWMFSNCEKFNLTNYIFGKK